jgi:hypothetical protein
MVVGPHNPYAQEIFDGGPTKSGIPDPNTGIPDFGYLGAWAALPPQGQMSGDTMNAGNWWNAGGFSPDNCEGVMEIQDYIGSFTQNTTAYFLYGPNSNSVAFSAGDTYFNLPVTPHDPSPGWNQYIP